MTIVEQSVTSLQNSNALERIEYAGRVCYNSTDKIKKGESALPFVRGLVSAGHGTPLEAAMVLVDCSELIKYIGRHNPYCVASQCRETLQAIKQRHIARTWPVGDDRITITVRDFLSLGFPLDFLCTDSHYQMDPRFGTVIIVTDRGIANEAVRHRVLHYDDNGYPADYADPVGGEADDMSMVQASTRYINYGKKPFSVIRPCPAPWSFDEDSEEYRCWYASCEQSFAAYKDMLAMGVPQQFARDVLPLSTTTTVVMSGTDDQWESFLKLRLDKAAHPRMIVLADMILHSDAVRSALGHKRYASLCEFEVEGIKKVNEIKGGCK